MRLKRLILLREKPEVDRTQGVLHWGSRFVAFTMEPGTADTDAPRVAPGWYMCEPHGWDPGSAVRYKETYALVGHDVSHYPEAGVARSAILIHAGNVDDHTRGCILLGLRRGELSGEPAVLDSKAALEALRDLVGKNSFGLSVVER